MSDPLQPSRRPPEAPMASEAASEPVKVFVTVDDAGSLGPLTRPFLFEDALGPLSDELGRAADACALYAQAGLRFLHLLVRLDRRDARGAAIPNGVAPDASWKQDARERAYSAEFDFQLSALVGRQRRGDRAELLQEALAVIRGLSVQAAAQAAVELEVDAARIRQFLAQFPEVPVTLRPRRKRVGKARRPPLTMLDVQVLHEGGSPALLLQRRAAIRELLEDVLAKAKLGWFDGGSSGEFHFEFGFLVRDAETAMQAMRAALLASGIPAAAIGFEVTGARE